MLFKQLFENESSTYTYLISCQEKQQAILIDPVLETLDRDLSIIRKLNLKLTHAVDTHIHADHVTSASALREILGCKVAGPANDNLTCRDINFENHPVFSNKYHLTGESSSKLKSFFTSELIIFFENQETYHIESNENSIIIFKSLKKAKINDIKKMVEFSELLTSLIHKNQQKKT